MISCASAAVSLAETRLAAGHRRARMLRLYSRAEAFECTTTTLDDFFVKLRSMMSSACPSSTDLLRSYGAALKEIGAADRQETGRWLNNRAENSHLPFRRRERTMLRFRRMRSLQKFASVHASVYNHFNQERSLSTRPNFKLNRAAALAEWRLLCSA